MYKKTSKILICFLFIITILQSLVVESFAAVSYDPWGSDPEQFYQYGFNSAALPNEAFVVVDNRGLYLTYSDDGHISRTIDNVVYQCDTQVLSPDNGVSIVHPTNLGFFLDGTTDFMWLQDEDHPVTQFTDLDVIFLVNIYGVKTQLPEDLFFIGEYQNVYPYDMSPSDVTSLSLDCDVIASTQYSSASITFVCRASFHLSSVDTYYCINNYVISDPFFREFYSQFHFNIVSSTPFCDSIIDVDIGLIDARIGLSLDHDFIDIWGNLPRPPQVKYPQIDTVSLGSVFASITSLDIVTMFIVPMGVITIGYFVIGTILWKR